jgi:serpin B
LFRIFLLISLLFGFAACENDLGGISDDDSKDDTDLTSEMETKYQQADLHAENVSPELVAANTKLALKLFNELNEEGENIMISPLSISIAMAMALNGASGDNFDEMKTVLEYDSMTMEDINTSFYNLINSLIEVDKDMSLFIADSLWMKESLADHFNDQYVTLLNDKYSAEPYLIDFSSGTALDEINGWVFENTNGKIEDILKEIDPNTLFMLINAIYFKAAWTYEFDENNTSEGSFTKSDATDVTVEYMKLDNIELDYCDPGTFRTVRMPYGRGKFSFYGIMPPEDKTVDELVTDINENGVDKYFENLSEKTVSVVLPKFKFVYFNDSLVNTFKKFGMEKAFVPDENDGGFGNMADFGDELAITGIIHKSFIEVSEKGTEAAAATIIAGDTGAPTDPPGFYGTKPFVYVIRDDRSETILFMGKVEDPTVEEQ